MWRLPATWHPTTSRSQSLHHRNALAFRLSSCSVADLSCPTAQRAQRKQVSLVAGAVGAIAFCLPIRSTGAFSHPPPTTLEAKGTRANLTAPNSRQSLKKYVQSNNKINIASQSAFDAQFNKAIKTGVEKGDFTQPKGRSLPVALPV